VIFEQHFLETYKTLIQTTELQKGYQEFIKLFRFLRIELEKEFSEYAFSGNIVENAMDYSYFQFTNEHLKKQGLKVVVVFVHVDFCFEVWISGLNRKIQRQYYNELKDIPVPFILNDTPSKVDYILKLPLNRDIPINNGGELILEIKRSAMELIEWVAPN